MADSGLGYFVFLAEVKMSFSIHFLINFDHEVSVSLLVLKIVVMRTEFASKLGHKL